MNTKLKRPRDTNQLAKLIAGIATGDVADKRPDDGKDPAAVALGKKGGLKGGVARKNAINSERRSEIARDAANKRWKKER